MLVSQLVSDLPLKRLWMPLLTHGDVWYQRFVYFAGIAAIFSLLYKTFKVSPLTQRHLNLYIWVSGIHSDLLPSDLSFLFKIVTAILCI